MVKKCTVTLGRGFALLIFRINHLSVVGLSITVPRGESRFISMYYRLMSFMNSQIRSLIHNSVLYHISIPYYLAIILLVFSAGCGQYASVSSVDPLAKEYFEALKAGNLDKVMGMYSEDFFKSFPEETWRQQLQRLTTELGPIKAYSFRNKQADSRFSGKFYIYQYDTIHKSSDGKEKRAKHTITFIQPVNSSDIKLVGHRIVAPGFN